MRVAASLFACTIAAAAACQVPNPAYDGVSAQVTGNGGDVGAHAGDEEDSGTGGKGAQDDAAESEGPPDASAAGGTVPRTGDGGQLGSAGGSPLRLNQPGLLAAWDLDEGTGGRAIDATEGRSVADLLGGASWTQGHQGGALSLSGTSAYARVDAPAVLNRVSTTGQVTLVAWVYLNDRKNLYAVATRQWKQTDSDAFGLFFYGGRLYPAIANDSGDGNVCISSTDAPVGAWVFVAMTYDGRTLRGYENGVEKCRASFTGKLGADSTPLLIGANADDPQGTPMFFFNGRIDDLRLFDRALSASELEALATGDQP